MTPRAVILAAHGSTSRPAVNAMIAEWAEALVARGVATEARAAFHQGSPGFAEALAGLEAKHVTVVPVMTSRGYYSDEVLPRELARNANYTEKSVTIAGPLGTHPGMADLAARRAGELAERYSLELENTHVLVIGHGTKRNPASRVTTEQLVSRLAAQAAVRSVSAAFLDDDPGIEAQARRLSGGPLIALPFLIGAGDHALLDLPERLGFPKSGDVTLPRAEQVAGRTIVCDRPLGADPGVFELLIEVVTEGSPVEVSA